MTTRKSSRPENNSAQLRRMPDILSVRLNDEEKPTRGEEFERALAVGGATATNVIRALVDGYVRRVSKTGKLPSFPLIVLGSDEAPSHQ